MNFQDKKKLLLCAALILCLAHGSEAAKLQRIRFGYYPEKIRAALDFNDSFSYTAEQSKDKIIIHLASTEAAPEISNFIELSDLIVRYFEVEKEDDGLRVTIPLGEPVKYNIFSLNDPSRLVIDFDREFTNIVSGGTVAGGIELQKVTRGTESGRVNANVIRIDLAQAEIAPALARKKKLNIFESFINFLNPWKEKDDDNHFYRARVSDIADEQGALAAVNGTYFAYTGKPLGTLLIDKELVSSPIHDRTAILFTDDKQVYIDNILINCFFLAQNGVRYDITGVNQGRDKNAVVLYSPAWGDATGTGGDGLEIVVVDSIVKEIRLGNSAIPQNGYVISMSGPQVQFVGENIKVGDKLDTRIKIVPYATSPRTILHLVSGGPRLAKNGVVYVSKNEEKFRSDIARGRAARTAVGITRDSKVILVTVDGLPRNKSARSERDSIGMTLEELAGLMIDLGAVDAMNLDGGSSTTMWVDGRVINQPVGGSQSRVSNALVVRPR
jgi:exopolysaccharide biosynthesis protein